MTGRWATEFQSPNKTPFLSIERWDFFCNKYPLWFNYYRADMAVIVRLKTILEKFACHFTK
jgi:hypothetical protein